MNRCRLDDEQADQGTAESFTQYFHHVTWSRGITLPESRIGDSRQNVFLSYAGSMPDNQLTSLSLISCCRLAFGLPSIM